MTEAIYLLPEIILSTLVIGLVLAEIGYYGEKVRLVSPITFLGLGAALVQLFVTYSNGPVQLFNQSFIVDGLSFCFKIFFIVLALLVTVVSIYSYEITYKQRTEYLTFICGATLAGVVLSSATDLVLIYISLQLLNFACFFLAGYSKKSLRSTEASVKFTIFGAVSTTFFLFSSALFFSETKTLNLYEMHHYLVQTPLSEGTALVASVLLFLALCFYLGSFPMYLWVPDVLHGAPTPSSLYFSLAIPATGIVLMIRFIFIVLTGSTRSLEQWEVFSSFNWDQLIVLASGCSMLIGALVSAGQKKIKRLLAFLCVSHSGFLLMGFLTLDAMGISALLYNLFVALFSLVGVYSVFSYFYDRVQSDEIDHYNGLLFRALPESICLIFFLGCFVGLPPFPGFLGRFALIGAVLGEQHYGLAALAIFSGILIVVAFARLTFGLVREGGGGEIKFPVTTLPSPTQRQRAFFVFLMIPVVLLTLFADQFLQWTHYSFQFILW